MTLGVPPPYGAPAPRAEKPRRHWGYFAAGFVSGFFSLVALGLLFNTVWKEPELTLHIEAPESVRAGETFTARLQAQNPHAEPVELDRVEVSLSALERTQIALLEPQADPLSPNDMFGMRTWTFDRPVAPGAEIAISFAVTARAPGSQQLEPNVCNDASDCSPARTSLEVVASAEP